MAKKRSSKAVADAADTPVTGGDVKVETMAEVIPEIGEVVANVAAGIAENLEEIVGGGNLTESEEPTATPEEQGELDESTTSAEESAPTIDPVAADDEVAEAPEPLRDDTGVKEVEITHYVLSKTFATANAHLGTNLFKLVNMTDFEESARQKLLFATFQSLKSALSICKDGEFSEIMENVLSIFAKEGTRNLSEKRLTSGITAGGLFGKVDNREYQVLVRILSATAHKNVRRDSIAALSWGPLMDGLSGSKSGEKIADRLKRFYGV